MPCFPLPCCTEVESDCLLDPRPSLLLFGEACPLLLPLLSLFDEVVDGGDCTGSRLAPSDPSLAAELVIAGAAIIGTRSLTSIGTLSPDGLTSTGSRPARHSKVKPSSTRRPSERTDGESSKTNAVAEELQLPSRTDTSLSAWVGPLAVIKFSGPPAPGEHGKLLLRSVHLFAPSLHMSHYQ